MNAEAKFVSSVMDARLKKVKRERDAYKKQRDELINDMAEVKRKAEAYNKIKEAADNQRLNGFVLYDNDSFIYKLNCVFDEMESNHER
ncbi:hypothetical protein HMPREF2953_03635 [Staphylococcus sp. HMSC072E01]|uniref:hypothetical protein n=1 Tax=Staphylococcus sp. HMSC072E01 TaxID=1739457 RepID=UPI0008A2EF8F|nr:hypothetical protein [Staphylococcus sp. HMSC072E01]OFQ11051.1 hypothetical protein HMPREF2953_03635 [Staphylococcus sp. HMSC072E01]